VGIRRIRLDTDAPLCHKRSMEKKLDTHKLVLRVPEPLHRRLRYYAAELALPLNRAALLAFNAALPTEIGKPEKRKS